jgi:large subunit ribosomal protein L13
MDTLSYKTISANKETAKKEWVVVDATDQIVGRLCSKVAKLLRGKYKPNFTPHVDCGDNVIIINAAKVVSSPARRRLTRSTHVILVIQAVSASTHPAELRKRKDGIDKMIRHAVKGMLPKGPLGRSLMDNLFMYSTVQSTTKRLSSQRTIDINQYK